MRKVVFYYKQYNFLPINKLNSNILLMNLFSLLKFIYKNREKIERKDTYCT